MQAMFLWGGKTIFSRLKRTQSGRIFEVCRFFVLTYKVPAYKITMDSFADVSFMGKDTPAYFILPAKTGCVIARASGKRCARSAILDDLRLFAVLFYEKSQSSSLGLSLAALVPQIVPTITPPEPQILRRRCVVELWDPLLLF